MPRGLLPWGKSPLFGRQMGSSHELQNKGVNPCMLFLIGGGGGHCSHVFFDIVVHHSHILSLPTLLGTHMQVAKWSSTPRFIGPNRQAKSRGPPVGRVHLRNSGSASFASSSSSEPRNRSCGSAAVDSTRGASPEKRAAPAERRGGGGSPESIRIDIALANTKSRNGMPRKIDRQTISLFLR